MIALLLLAAVVSPMIHDRWSEPSRVKCASNLKQIGMGLILYVNDHGGSYPDTLAELITEADLNPEVFVCRWTTDTPAHSGTASRYQ